MLILAMAFKSVHMLKFNKILAATSNANKLKEIRTVASEFGIEIISPKELRESRKLAEVPDVEENENTYHGNALLKARAYAKWASMPALADDSGLEVACLDNRPGVLSARYAGVGSSDREKIAMLISEIANLESEKGVQERTAHFCCSLSLYVSEKEIYSAEARLKGHVLESPRGNKGFGYDPIILIEKLGKTLAEVDFELTCREGFRAEALRNLFEKISAK